MPGDSAPPGNGSANDNPDAVRPDTLPFDQTRADAFAGTPTSAARDDRLAGPPMGQSKATYGERRYGRQQEIDDVVLSIEHLSVSFGGLDVLREINIQVRRGETLVVIGESGCGKTVLLKTIVGLIDPTRGRVVFDGKSIHALDDRELTKARLRFGFVFQQAALFDSLSVFENVAFGLREHAKMTAEEVGNEVRELLLQVGLSTNIVNKKPAELSGGMRKRVGLARALALHPEVMLYDEPTTGLDPIMSDVINELILKTRKRQKPTNAAVQEKDDGPVQATRTGPITSVVITHDMKSALKIATRIVMLFPLARLGDTDRQILFDGTPEEIERSADPRVAQFVRGEAGERLMEMTRG